MADTDPNSTINTGGGAYVGGDVDAHTFVGRDYVTNVTIQVTGAELSDLAQTLATMLSAQGVRMREGMVSAGVQMVDVSPARVDALRQYLDAAPGVTQSARIDQYLLRLCVDPAFHRWQRGIIEASILDRPAFRQGRTDAIEVWLLRKTGLLATYNFTDDKTGK